MRCCDCNSGIGSVGDSGQMLKQSVGCYCGKALKKTLSCLLEGFLERWVLHLVHLPDDHFALSYDLRLNKLLSLSPF